jgi:hypothetical protein
VTVLSSAIHYTHTSYTLYTHRQTDTHILPLTVISLLRALKPAHRGLKLALDTVLRRLLGRPWGVGEEGEGGVVGE